MNSSFVNFAALKQSISMAQVLRYYGVRFRTVGEYALRGKCPLPTHTSVQSTDSFFVDLRMNFWVCHSSSCIAARAGRKGGTVLDFVAAFEKCSLREAGLRLLGRSADWPAASGSATQVPTLSMQRHVNTELSFALRGIDSTHPFLRHRGIDTVTAKYFGVGFYDGNGLMNRRIVIPIHNENGQLVAYAGRSIDGRKPRYRFPPGFRKSLELFNLHRIGQFNHVVIVEGFFDCMKVHQAGFQCVAIMGSSLSGNQEDAICQSFLRVQLLFDGDTAGRKATDDCARRLSRKCFVQALKLSEGKQPDSMSATELCEVLSRV